MVVLARGMSMSSSMSNSVDYEYLKKWLESYALEAIESILIKSMETSKGDDTKSLEWQKSPSKKA